LDTLATQCRGTVFAAVRVLDGKNAQAEWLRHSGEAQSAVTPGQGAVFYSDDVVLSGTAGFVRGASEELDFSHRLESGAIIERVVVSGAVVFQPDGGWIKPIPFKMKGMAPNGKDKSRGRIRTLKVEGCATHQRRQSPNQEQNPNREIVCA
jgi:hypothetical protein